MAETVHAGRAREVLSAVSDGNLDSLMGQLTDDVLWHVGGDHPLSGDYRGKDAVKAYHERVAELTGGTLKLEPTDVLASDRYVGIFLRAGADAGGRTLNTTMVEAARLSDDGRWQEFWALAEDQPAVDEFWKAVVR